MENEETWDTGEVRLHLDNDQGLYNAWRALAEDSGLSADNLQDLWVEHELNLAVNLTNVAWASLARELSAEWLAHIEENTLGELGDGNDYGEDYSADELQSRVYAEVSRKVTQAQHYLTDALNDPVEQRRRDPGKVSYCRGRLQGLQDALYVLTEDSVLDVSSSASRQHYIDTGRYLRRGEVQD